MKCIFCLLLAVAPCTVAQTVQGPEWVGHTLQGKGMIIGMQSELAKSCALVLLRAPLPGRVWVCNPQFASQGNIPVLEQREIKFQGRVTGVRKTRVGSRWQWAPEIERARVD